ncbi:MAG: hypothetical protein JWM96_1081 [Alphaproteobacteria bacterium]|nr:hypothetical protein [Alphaproteobacteria bacterium]
MQTTFDMITWAPEHYRAQAYEINNTYFTVDTAEPDEVYDWVNHNRLMVTYALHKDRVQGFFNVMPLTHEAGQLFSCNEIKEEEITTGHILAPHVMRFAEYLYFPAIASKEYPSYLARQCTAAMVSALATHILTMYDEKRLKKIFANPTTFQGNRMVQKLGLRPLAGFKKPLTGNDLYYADFDEAMFANLRWLQDRYARFVGRNTWVSGEWKKNLPPTE